MLLACDEKNSLPLKIFLQVLHEQYFEENSFV